MALSPGADLARRLAAAAVLIPISLAATWLGEFYFALLLVIGGVLVVLEWNRLSMRATGFGGATVPAVTIIAAIFVTSAYGPIAGMGVVIAGAGLAAIAVYWIANDTRDGAPWWGGSGVLYAGLAVISLAALRDSETFGLAAITWLFSLVWAGDSAAFAAGKLIGGPRLAPTISPAKTWAGAIAAVAAATMVGLVAAALLDDTSMIGLGAVSAGLGIVAILGDLFESGMKRRFGAKNAGDLIPGHGGMMDRVDGLVFAAIAAATIGVVRGGTFAPAEGVLIW